MKIENIIPAPEGLWIERKDKNGTKRYTKIVAIAAIESDGKQVIAPVEMLRDLSTNVVLPGNGCVLMENHANLVEKVIEKKVYKKETEDKK